MSTTTPEKDRKLRQLILYISRLSENDPQFGKTKLNKLLFYCDFLAYLRLGEPITHQAYIKLDYGPAPRRMLHVQGKMVTSGKLAIQHVNGREKPIALDTADLEEFTTEQVDLIRDVIEDNWNLNARAISEKSHNFAGWEFAEKSETIPYSVALVGFRDLTPEEIQFGVKYQKHALECLARA